MLHLIYFWLILVPITIAAIALIVWIPFTIIDWLLEKATGRKWYL